MPPKRNQKGSAKSSKAPSKAASKAPSKAPSGASTPALREPVQKAPGLLGVNFGQAFSSVAIIDKEGLADCIANDDGERQIASALSFSGSEFVRVLARTRLHALGADTCARMQYSGVPARTQLVRNASNTILGFRNLLGKRCVCLHWSRREQQYS